MTMYEHVCWFYLLNPECDLGEDTVLVYDELCEQLGQAKLGKWIVDEYPWLLKPETPLLRVWWVLWRKLDELNDCTLRAALQEHGQRAHEKEIDDVSTS